jgi:plastocyanin
MSGAIKTFSKCASLLLLISCLSACGPSQPPKTYTVEIRNMAFVPADITVNKGDTIKWVNHDMMAHDVTEQTTKAWSSGPIQADSTWKMAVTDEADYFCSIHVVMKGKIELK